MEIVFQVLILLPAVLALDIHIMMGGLVEPVLVSKIINKNNIVIL